MEAAKNTQVAEKPRFSRVSGTAGTALAIEDKVLSPTVSEPQRTGARARSTHKIEVNNDSCSAPASAKAASYRCGSEPKIGSFAVEQPTKVEGSRPGRRSTALRLAEVRNIRAAAVFAVENSLHLNRHTTIHFEAARIADPVETLRRYMKLARDWLSTRGAPFAYIWVRESGQRKGEHAHVLMHVPAELVRDFARLEPSWRKRVGARRSRGAFRSTPVGRSYLHAAVGVQYGEAYTEHLQTIIGYLVKGADQRTVSALRLDLVQPSGEFWGKRTGMSENINRAARARRQAKPAGGRGRSNLSEMRSGQRSHSRH